MHRIPLRTIAILAESVRLELTRPFLSDGLANRCLNHSANFPKWQKIKKSNLHHLSAMGRFSRPLEHHAPYLPKFSQTLHSMSDLLLSPTNLGRRYYHRLIVGAGPSSWCNALARNFPHCCNCLRQLIGQTVLLRPTIFGNPDESMMLLKVL